MHIYIGLLIKMYSRANLIKVATSWKIVPKFCNKQQEHYKKPAYNTYNNKILLLALMVTFRSFFRNWDVMLFCRNSKNI